MPANMTSTDIQTNIEDTQAQFDNMVADGKITSPFHEKFRHLKDSAQDALNARDFKTAKLYLQRMHDYVHYMKSHGQFAEDEIRQRLSDM